MTFDIKNAILCSVENVLYAPKEVFMKKVLSMLMAIGMLVCSISTANVFAFGDNELSIDFIEEAITEIPVFMDGSKLDFDVPAQIISDRTMVPLRAIFEALGATVEWDDTTKTAVSKKGDTVVKITIGEYKLIKNDADITIDVPAQIIDSRTLVPVRAIAESFDCVVEWLDDLRTVRIVSEVLPDPVETENDTAIAFYLNDTPVSRAKYNFFKALVEESIGSTPEEAQVLEVIKQFYAARLYLDELSMPLTKLDMDYVNKLILAIKANGTYDNFVETYNTSDKALREYFLDTFVIEIINMIYHEFNNEDLVTIARREYVNVKHILVKTKEEADAIITKLNEGASFEELVTEYSLDSMDVETGYVFTKGEMVKEFETVSFELADGEISAPVETAYGFHIIKKYPMSELSDEFILINYGNKIFTQANTQKINQDIQRIISNITYKEA